MTALLLLLLLPLLLLLLVPPPYRRILRYLYGDHLKRCWLLSDVKPKFFDALLGVARLETFMPQVSVCLCVGGVALWPGMRWGKGAGRGSNCLFSKGWFSKGALPPASWCSWWALCCVGDWRG